MKATVAVYFRVPASQMARIKRAAKARGLTVAAWIREAAILTAEQNPDLARNYPPPFVTDSDTAAVR